MADSNITKNALASALKHLMTKMPFSKISIGDICTRCQMNRKSFYYHFKDKEDLVIWIFDTEFTEISKENPYNSAWEGMKLLVYYFYENRSFYKKALKIEGQNSLCEHLRSRFYLVLSERLKVILGTENTNEIQIDFFTDGIICTIKRWLTASECIPPDEFMKHIQSCIYIASKRICSEFDQKGEERFQM